MDVTPDTLLGLIPADAALFLDLDGTLAEFCLRPEAVSIPCAVRSALARMADAGMPLAVVSGRPLADIDRLLAPGVYPAAGVHGAQRRDASGTVHELPASALPPPGMAAELQARLEAWPGTFLEDKGIALALHFRAAPQYEMQVAALAREVLRRHAHLREQPGKYVVELKPAGVDKGSAIAAFLDEPPFAGRLPVFVGDDRTDETGFAVVAARGGLSVKVGPGPTQAMHRLPDVAAVHAWLHKLAAGMGVPLSRDVC